MPERRYDTPEGKMGRRFFRALSNKIRGMRVHRWNAEHFIVFQKMIVQQKFHFTTAQAIRKRIKKLPDAWEAGQHQVLDKERARI